MTSVYSAESTCLSSFAFGVCWDRAWFSTRSLPSEVRRGVTADLVCIVGNRFASLRLEKGFISSTPPGCCGLARNRFLSAFRGSRRGACRPNRHSYRLEAPGKPRMRLYPAAGQLGGPGRCAQSLHSGGRAYLQCRKTPGERAARELFERLSRTIADIRFLTH